jgi:hypothetical protein
MKKSHFKDRVCDNVLPGQGYRTPQGGDERCVQQLGDKPAPVQLPSPLISHESTAKSQHLTASHDNW